MTHSEAGNDGADRRARRRRPEHGLIRPERQAARLSRDAGARSGSDRGARLPSAPSRPRSLASSCVTHHRPFPALVAMAAAAVAADLRRRGRTSHQRERLRAASVGPATTDPETITQLVARGAPMGVILMETLHDDPRVERLLTRYRSFSSGAPATRRESATLIWTSQMPSRRAWHTWRGSATPAWLFSTSRRTSSARVTRRRCSPAKSSSSVHLTLGFAASTSPALPSRATRSRRRRNCCARRPHARRRSPPAGSSRECSARSGRQTFASPTISRSCRSSPPSSPRCSRPRSPGLNGRRSMRDGWPPRC